MEQFKESLKLQLGESCQKEGYILSELNPYICEQEVMQAFIKKGANINSRSIKFIEIKGLIFNKVIWLKIDEFLSNISKKTRFGVHNAELWYKKMNFMKLLLQKKEKKTKQKKEKSREFRTDKERWISRKLNWKHWKAYS